MDQTNQSVTGASGQPNLQAPSVAPASAGKSSVYLWVVIIVGLVAAAGLWWYYQITNMELDSAAEEITQPSRNSWSVGRDSNATADIEASLQDMELDGLDRELNDIDVELSQ